jgi:16S rRNA (guanine527-N7)-methyltransferase
VTTPDPIPPPPDLAARAEASGIAFDEGDVERLGAYLALLLDANTRFNLTAIRDPAEAWERHLLDSLTLLPYLLEARAATVVDVGTGGGLPGVPLAIAAPAIQFTLLEATGKKADFLKDAVRRLDLANVRVVNDRAENAGRAPEHREQYDVATARAVGPLAVLVEYTLPFVRVGGHLLAIKGQNAPKEVTDARVALSALHAEVVDTARTATGTIVVVEKHRRTSPKYPRRPGEPKRAPIGSESK